MGDIVQHPGDHASPDQQHERREGDQLAEGKGQRAQDVAAAQPGQARQQDQDQDHGEILGHQPSRP